MSPRVTKTLVTLLILSVALLGGMRPANACGPFTRYPIYSYTKHPDLPFERFAGGELGVLQPTYARSYLYVAYRLMNGMSLTARERQALIDLWHERLNYNQESGEEPAATAVWFEARRKVPGIGENPQIIDYRQHSDNYSSFYNCHEDAFRSAARTLEERIAKFGVASPEVSAWTQAQDKVFANCGGGDVTIPEAAPANLAPQIQADRAYQIAAAHFYATNFDEAKSHFERIATDAASPWREHGRYLAARSLIRKASVGKEVNRTETLAAAEAELEKALAELRPGALRQSAQNLLQLVKMRSRPAEAIRDLSRSLLSKEANDNIKQELWDYTILLDRYLGESYEPLDEEQKKAVETGGQDELTDWLLTYQAEPKASLAYSIEKWEKTSSQAWLVAALTKVDAGHAKAAALMSAAEAVKRDAPAFFTVRMHLVRLLMAKGDKATARRILDAILQSHEDMPISGLNFFRHQRMMLAESLDEFLRYAQRRPAAFSWDDDGNETPINLKEDEELKDWAGRVLLDVDSLHFINHLFPVQTLREAANNSRLPEHIRRQIALAAWTRAAILDDAENARALAPVASALAPELKPSLDAYLSARTPASMKTQALYTILKFPGLKPYVDGGTGRHTPLAERDIYRDNWWCEASLHTGSAMTEGAAESEGSQPTPAAEAETLTAEFLSDALQASAKSERARLVSLGAAPNYFAREAIEWSNRTPNDPRAPEALHIAVTATRYGCTNKETGRWSKAAFDLLHKRYPRSPWAKKTPYWFKDV